MTPHGTVRVKYRLTNGTADCAENHLQRRQRECGQNGFDESCVFVGVISALLSPVSLGCELVFGVFVSFCRHEPCLVFPQLRRCSRAFLWNCVLHCGVLSLVPNSRALSWNCVFHCGVLSLVLNSRVFSWNCILHWRFLIGSEFSRFLVCRTWT